MLGKEVGSRVPTPGLESGGAGKGLGLGAETPRTKAQTRHQHQLENTIPTQYQQHQHQHQHQHTTPSITQNQAPPRSQTTCSPLSCSATRRRSTCRRSPPERPLDFLPLLLQVMIYWCPRSFCFLPIPPLVMLPLTLLAAASYGEVGALARLLPGSYA